MIEPIPGKGETVHSYGEEGGSSRRRRAARRCAPLVISTLLLAALTSTVFFPEIFFHWSFPWDFLGKYSASPAWVASTVGRGQWSEWIPFEAGGTSLAIDLQAGLYYPLWWLLGALHITPTLHVLTLIQIAHVWFGALGVLMLARARHLSWRWSLVAAVPFIFFGGFFGNAEHADYFRGFAYLPWLLYLLTLPRNGAAVWARTALLPFLFWALAAGAYPAQTVSFGIIALSYLSVEVITHRDMVACWRHLLPLALGLIGSALVVFAIFLPYVHALSLGLLYRPNPVTLVGRASKSFHIVDLLGAYLNDFAWNQEGTGLAWAVGVPVIVGLAGIRRRDLHAQSPIVVAAVVALILGSAAQWPPVGELMLRLPLIFQSRFPDNDYKAMIGVGLVLLSSLGWRSMLESHRQGRWVAPAAGASVLVVGVFVAPHTTSFVATPVPALTILMALAVLGVAWAAPRLRELTLIGLLLLLILIDGGRMLAGWPQYPDGTRPWGTPPANLTAAGAIARDAGARRLPELLANPPARRPARPALPVFSGGYNGDTNGYFGLAYELGDDAGAVYEARWRAQTDPTLHMLMLLPWTAWTFPCTEVRCNGSSVALPPVVDWKPDPRVTTIRFATSSITYVVDLSRPVIMVENELDIAGWSADYSGVQRVNVGGVLRGWRLPAGHYTFVASFRQPERALQELAAGGALLMVALIGVVALRARHRRTGDASKLNAS